MTRATGKRAQTKRGRLSPGVIAGIILLLIFGVSLYIRIFLPYDQVFVADSVRFRAADPWYFMRLMDSLLHNFPHLITFDPYALYPSGAGGPAFPGFTYLLASVIWLIGFGSPSPHTIDTVAAYFPAILGALMVIPVYVIGKEVFNRWVGLLSAALIAILPGQFLYRTLLGFTDHHMAEIFFTTLTIMFLILAIKKAQQRQISFSHFRGKNWTTIATPLIYSLLAGIALGIYLFSWRGGLIFVFILTCYLILQFIIDHLRRKSTDYLCIIGTLSLLIALVISLSLVPRFRAPPYLPSLLIAIAVPLILSAVSRLMAKGAIKPVYYPVALAGLGLIILTAFHFINPQLLGSMMGPFRIFIPPAFQMVEEMNPLLFYRGYFSLLKAWEYFTTGFFISFLAFGWLIYAIKKEDTPGKTLLLIWYVVIMVLALSMSRFAYYLAVNVALLTGYFSWKILEFAGFRESTEAMKTPEKLRKKKAKVKPKRDLKKLLPPIANQIKLALAVIVVFFLVFFPNIGPAKTVAEAPPRIDDGWYSSLQWLKENSPEPFSEPDFYYQLYEPPPPGKSYEPPPSAYSIVALWDTGYWITRIAHRIPISSPGGGRRIEGSFFAAQDEASANKIMDKLGARYVITDYLLTSRKFIAIATYAGKDLSQFWDDYYQPTADGGLQRVTLFYPEYYRSLCARLYNFDGKAVIPENSTTVISYREKLDGEKELISLETFPTYEAAEAYVATQGGNYRVVGTDPFISPVPLEALKHYKLIHSSEEVTIMPHGETIPTVKIFDYVKAE